MAKLPVDIPAMEISDHAEKQRTFWKVAMAACLVIGTLCFTTSGFMIWQLFQLPIKGGPFVQVGDDAFGKFLSYARTLAFAPGAGALILYAWAFYCWRRMLAWDRTLL